MSRHIDAIGAFRRAELVANMLEGSQEQLEELGYVQRSNGHDDDHKVPSKPGENLGTYGERRKMLQDSLDRLYQEPADVLQRAERILKVRQQSRAAEFKRIEAELAEQERAGDDGDAEDATEQHEPEAAAA